MNRTCYEIDVVYYKLQYPTSITALFSIIHSINYMDLFKYNLQDVNIYIKPSDFWFHYHLIHLQPGNNTELLTIQYLIQGNACNIKKYFTNNVILPENGNRFQRV